MRDGDEGAPESCGRWLTAEEAEPGWIGLFDRTTDFGWTGGQASDGPLTAGATTTEVHSSRTGDRPS